MPAALNRRDLNRERTRTALFEAVLGLIETEGLEALTAERIADVAGVSRRTFFNYYPSVDALIAAGAQDVLGQIETALTGRPAGEPLIDGLLSAVDEVFSVDLLAASVRVWRAVDKSPSASRYASEARAAHNDALAHAWAQERLVSGGARPDPLWESIAMASLGVAFEEARREWLNHHDGTVDASSLANFLAIVHRAFDLVRPVVERRSQP